MSKQLNIRGTPDGVLETNTAQGYPLGTRMHVEGERIFRYAKNGTTALSVARVVQAALPDFGLENAGISEAVRARTDIKVTVLKTAIGSVISTNEYEDGLLFVNDGNGEGHVYSVAGNSSAGTANTTAVFTLVAPPRVQIDAGSRVTVLRNRYRNVLQFNSGGLTPTLGIAPVAVAANSYFWLQTGGPCAALQQDDLVVNLPIAASTVTAGAVQVATNVVPQYGFGNDASSRGATGYTVVQAPGGNIVAVSGGSGNRERLAPVSGLAVVPKIPIGWCMNARQHGQHCLVWLTLEV